MSDNYFTFPALYLITIRYKMHYDNRLKTKIIPAILLRKSDMFNSNVKEHTYLKNRKNSLWQKLMFKYLKYTLLTFSSEVHLQKSQVVIQCNFFLQILFKRKKMLHTCIILYICKEHLLSMSVEIHICIDAWKDFLLRGIK